MNYTKQDMQASMPVYDGGKLDAFLKATDWESTTSLGNPAYWVPMLKTCLQIVLQNPTPVCLLWGNEYHLFINEAATTGIDYFSFFSRQGQSAAHVLGSFWGWIEPVIRNVQQGHSLKYDHIAVPLIDKTGNAQFSFDLNPVKDEAGNVAAILVYVKQSSHFLPDKSLWPAIGQGEHLFRQLVLQSPSAMCILKGQDLVVEIANAAYLDMVLRSAAEFVGKPLLQVLPELKDQGIRTILDDVFNTGKPFYGYEYPVFLRNRGTNGFFNFTYQPLHEPETPGVVSGIIVVVTDVTSQVIAKHRLQQSEKQFKNLVLQSPVPMAILSGEHMVIEMANHAMLKQIWHKEFAAVKQQKLLDVFPALKGQLIPALLKQVYETGQSCRQNEVPERVDTTSGPKEYYLDLVFEPLFEIDGSVQRVIITMNDVTEKVNSRRLIEDAETRLRLAIEAASMGTFDWNLKNMHFEASQRVFEIFGFNTSASISHLDLIGAFHPADKPIRDNAVKNAPVKGSLEYEARIIKPGNVINWVKVSGKIVYDSNHEPLRMYGTVQDVTKAKNALFALEESENRLNIAISNAALGTYDVDFATSQVVCSPRLYEILDIPTGNMVSRDDIQQILYPEDKPKRNEAHLKSLETGRVEYESRICWRDGSVRWIKVNSRLMTDEKKRPLRILGTVMDITEQKNYINQLEESERRFRMVADTAPVMIWLAGTDKKCYFFNKAWLQFTGRTIEQEFGNGWAEGVHADDLEKCLLIYEQAFNQRQEFYMEYRLRMADGTYHWISDNGVPRFAANGEFLGYIGGCMDIDARKRENEQLTMSEARLRIAALSGELGTWDYDPATEELYWDDACSDMFGVTYEHPSSVTLFWSVVHADDDPYLTEKVRQALDPSVAATLDVEFRAWVNPEKNRFKWIAAKGKAFFKDGQPYRFAGTALDITEKKLALEALRESELLFKTISITAPVVLWLTDSNGRNTFVNKTWNDWTGRMHTGQEDENWLDALIAEDRSVVEQVFFKAFEKREKFSCEFRFTNTNNEICHCLNEGFPYYNNDGSFAGYAGSVTDISQQYKNVEALRKSEERFRLLSDAMPQFVWTADGAGRLNYFNETVFEYAGVNLTELEGVGWLQIVHPDDRQENIERWQHSILTGKDFFFEHRFKRKDGSYRWQLSRALPQKTSDGSIQMWIGTSTDIHDQKIMAGQLEQMVRQRTAELQEMNDELLRQKEFVEVIIDSSLIMVTVFDINKTVIAFNNKCETVFNRKKENVIGVPFKDVFPGIEFSPTYENINRAIAGETIHASKYRSIINNRYYESYFVPLRNQEGTVYAVLMTAHDITEIVSSAEKVQEAYDILEKQNNALERSNQELESFSYVASHDLQEPLRKIQTFIELLHRNLDNREESERYFDKIRMSAQRMAALIRDVLNYSRLTKTEDSWTEVDLNNTVEEVKTDFELLIAEKNAVVIADRLPVITGNKLQLQQLFTNLISNSLKFCEEAPKITVNYKQVIGSETGVNGLANAIYHYLAVTDNGIGFEQQFADKIFTIFQRLNNRQYSGTGIGLALCKKIAENHNGTIIAESEPGKGATFHIYIPATTNN